MSSRIFGWLNRKSDAQKRTRQTRVKQRYARSLEFLHLEDRLMLAGILGSARASRYFALDSDQHRPDHYHGRSRSVPGYFDYGPWKYYDYRDGTPNGRSRTASTN